MDTDQLSKESYRAVIIEADKFSDDLTLQFGKLASSCKNEGDYLNKAKLLIQKIEELKGNQLLDIFFGNVPNENKLQNTLERMLCNISEVEKIPMENRHLRF